MYNKIHNNILIMQPFEIAGVPVIFYINIILN